MQQIRTDYELNRQTIDQISDRVQNYLSELKVERSHIQRIRLTVEELLLNIREKLCDGTTVSIATGRQSGRHILYIRFCGESYNPITDSENTWADEMIRSLGYSPSWAYRRGINTVSLILTDRARISSSVKILAAIFSAVCLSLIFNLIPGNLRETITESLLTPLTNSFLGLMNTFVGIMIGLTVCSGMTGGGSTSLSGQTGRRFILSIVGISFGINILTVGIVLPFLDLTSSAGVQDQSQLFSQITALFFGMLPSNPIVPFQTGNFTQIVVIALFIGMGIRYAGERGNHIRSLVDEGAVILQQTVSVVCEFIPIFVFATTFRMINSGQIQILGSLLKQIILILAVQMLIVITICFVTAWRLKCSPLLLIKKGLPVVFTAFATASSMSVLTLGMETCVKKFGIEKNMVSRFYPMGSVLYMPAGIAAFAASLCCIAEIFHVKIDLPWIITEVIMVTLIIMAAPPIPNGGLLIETVLFSLLGIPGEALVIATALELIFDHINTGLNIFLLLFRIANEANTSGQMDRKILLNPYS